MERIELAKWHADKVMPEQAKAKLFGILLKRVSHIVEEYPSDFYRDVQYLQNVIVNDGDWFYYSADKFGTHVGAHDTVLEFRKESQYEVVIRHIEEVWYADIKTLRLNNVPVDPPTRNLNYSRDQRKRITE